ncbi:DUF1302 domain-containing protein [Ponticaulis sp.]|uniref:DUF1302 domain-containing protein n=1 Tax=Ponticaulis sp. TaxID=2020902 RepID=UPI0025EAA273|nr:DUF1302 domain-containing protein [Ponticaulis sp.]
MAITKERLTARIPSMRKTLLATTFAGCAMIAAAPQASAFSWESESGDIEVNWDNTLKYSLGVRVEDPDPAVADNSIGPQANTNDGDLNFDTGIISNRLDILSELDIRFQRNFGFRVSGTAWYDTVYNDDNDNPGALGGALVNAVSVPAGQFTEATERLHGRDGEILDAFFYGNFTPGGRLLNVKVGRFTQLYGESLFMGPNGVAGAQLPLDLIRALSVPNSQFKEVARPVAQAAFQYSLSSEISIGGYYQFEWRKARLPAAGSYFSFADFVDEGGETIILGPGVVAQRGEDIEADDGGQFGFQFKYSGLDADYGFYFARFHDKLPQFYVRPGVGADATYIGDYVQVFAEDIDVIGASVSQLLGDMNFAAEVSYRMNQPLVATGNTVILPGDTISDGGDNSAFPRGNTWHLNASIINVLGENSLWDGATLIAEFAANHVGSIEENADQLDPLATQSAAAIQVSFVPERFAVMPGIDLKFPIGLSYGISGRSAVNGVLFPAENGGNLSLGLQADVRRQWQVGLSYTHYLGDAGSVIQYDTPVPTLSYDNFHGDRDFVSFSVQRTF